MRAELVLLGKRIDMAQRTRRRALVVFLYAALALLIACTWRWTGATSATTAWVFYGAMAVCYLFLGGVYRTGLVKPFKYRPPRNGDAAPSLLALKLNLYRPVLDLNRDEARNDERELRQRDHAHYIAYQAMAFFVMIPMLFGSLRIAQQRLLPLAGLTTAQFYYGLSMIAVVLFLTLPQAILLWTEPDMDE
ncbi:MAG: hypothetical protein ACLGSD_10375 [Acidobacteriota bacterium]